MAADYDTAVYVEQGGAKLVIASGGAIAIESGAAVDFGSMSSTTQTGMALSSTDATVFNVFADDNNVALTNAVYHAIRGRTMLFQPPTEGSIFSVMGQIKCADEVDFNPGVFAGVRGYIETMDDTDVKSGAKVWAVEGCLDAALASYTVKSGGISAGLHAELTGVGTFTQDATGILAGLYIDETAGTGTWGYGVYVASASVAIDTSTCPIILDAQPAIAATGKAIYVAGTMTDPGASDGHIGYFDMTYSGTQAGLSRNVGIWTNFAAGSTIANATYVLDLGVYDGSTNGVSGQVVVLNLDCQIASGSTPSKLAFIRTNSNQAGSDPDYLFWFNNNEAGCLTLSDPGTTFYGYIKCFSGTGDVVLAIPVVNVT